MTSRLVFYILSQLASTSSFKSVAQHVNLSGSTIARIFDKPSYTPSALPKVLAIDEFKGNTNHEKYQCIITDPKNHRILDILPNRYKAHLASYLLKFDTSQTSIFISDMWSTYRDLSRELFSFCNLCC